MIKTCLMTVLVVLLSACTTSQPLSKCDGQSKRPVNGPAAQKLSGVHFPSCGDVAQVQGAALKASLTS